MYKYVLFFSAHRIFYVSTVQTLIRFVFFDRVLQMLLFGLLCAFVMFENVVIIGTLYGLWSETDLWVILTVSRKAAGKNVGYPTATPFVAFR